MVTRLFAISAALIVVALVGAAMLNKKLLAPTIRADAVRGHGERGTCSDCHKILPGARSMPAASGPVAPRAVAAVAPAPAKQAAIAPTCAPCVTAALNPKPAPARPKAAIAVAAAQPGIAPAIVQGTLAPHDWRGPCAACHTLIKAKAQQAATVANADTAWTPTPALNQQAGAQQAAAQITTAQAARLAREVEALGMSVRATNGAIKGMMVIEVEGLARRSGIQLGDIVRAVDGRVTNNVNSFLTASGTADPARGVVIDASRDGTNQVVVLR